MVREKDRSKARINRDLEEKKNKKSRFEEGVNDDDCEYEEETTSGMSIPMDTDGPSIYQCTKVIPPGMVLRYASDDDSNSDYEPKDDDDNFLRSK